MAFTDIAWKGIYRTNTNSLIHDFYVPALSHAKQYDRAVGFFSSSMLAEAALGLSGLIKNQGRMRLLIGHPLSDEDWDAVQQGKTLSIFNSQICADLALILQRAGTERSVLSYELLSWMVATGSLEIRFAYKKGGMYHEKIGILFDGEGNRLVFHGSANESANALLPIHNFESLAVYPSWRTELFMEYGQPFAEGFETLWNNRSPEILTVGVPSEFYEKLLAFRTPNDLPPDLEQESKLLNEFAISNTQSDTPFLPSTIGGETYQLRPHQKDALQRWMANSYAGIFALATGSGKTITALHAATRFAQQSHPLVVIIAVPYQVLAEQWISVMRLFRMRPIKAFYSRDTWKTTLDTSISAFLAGATPFISIVVVNDTLATNEFQAILSRIPSHSLFFIGDECHHHSSNVWIDRIPVNAKFRLGMSATPWNPGRNDQQGNLEAAYGPVVATFSLRAALELKVLCPYSYYWVPCTFDDDEAAEYERIATRIAILVRKDPGGADPSVQNQLKPLYSRRARLLGSLRDKRTQLERMLRKSERSPHTLFYCGEGQHPLDAPGEDERVVNQVTTLLADLEWRVGRITAAESVSERQRVLASFDDGFIDAVAAIRVLDEGFDIPTCRTAYLLGSSSSYRQWVQRRGRVLRRSPGKEGATIYDFVPLPSPALLASNEPIWKRQLELELARVREFVELSRNSEAQQLAINNTMAALDLGAIYYQSLPISDEELYGD